MPITTARMLCKEPRPKAQKVIYQTKHTCPVKE